jgi:hypothetical protein
VICGPGAAAAEAAAAVAVDREVVVGHHVVAARGRAVVHARVVVHQGAALGDRAMLLRGRRRCRGQVRQTSKDQAAAKLQIIGHRWVNCRRREIAQARGPEIGQVAAMSLIGRTQVLDLPEAMLPIGRTQELGPAAATLLIGRTQVLDRALARVLSLDHDPEPARDHPHAMYKIFLICQTPVAGMSAAAEHQAVSVTWPQLQVARWPAARRPSF